MSLIQKDCNLRDFTTFRTGGTADFLVEAHTIEEIKEASVFAHEKKLPLRIVGGGSNILMDDAPFHGLVLRPLIKGVEVKELPVGEGSTALKPYFEVIAGAGESWDDFVAFTVSQNMYGLENLSLIPGTVGAAPVQNIGAYGAEVKDTIAFVEGIAIEGVENSENAGSGKSFEHLCVQRFSAEECGFGYRTSIFKEKLRGKFIITRVGFHLPKSGQVNIGYKDLQEYFSGQFSADIKLSQVRDAVVQIRKGKLPDLGEVGTAGSFFKNPTVTRAYYNSLAERYPGMPCFTEKAAADGDAEKELVKIPLGWILDKVCGLRGVREGQVGTWQGQALVLINYGGASAAEIRRFADMMAAKVKEKTGIEIEWEVEMWLGKTM